MTTKKQNQQTKKPTTNHRVSPDSAALTFSDHIGEFRRRIMWVALVFVIASSVAYGYRDVLMQLIMSPLQGEKLIYLTPGGGFSFIFQVTMYAGLLAAAPALIYQLYRFIRPALPARAQRSAPKVVVGAVALMLIGVVYGYFVAVPSALHFLSTFAGEDILPSLTADSYLSFFLAYIGGLGILFQLPLLLMFWHWVKPLGPGGLLKSERWVILFSFVAAALITPTPDVVNQAMIAVPLIAIYQLGVAAVIVSILRERHKQRHVRKPALVLEEKTEAVADPIPEVPVTEEKPSVAVAPVSAVEKPASPVALVAQAPRRRSIDGFTIIPSRSQPIKRAPSRPVPQREHQRPLLRRRPMMSIDGILTA